MNCWAIVDLTDKQKYQSYKHNTYPVDNQLFTSGKTHEKGNHYTLNTVGLSATS